MNITELTIYAISKSDFLASTIKKDLPLPRIVHKLNLVCRPWGAIDPIAEEITGLGNDALEKETAFNEKTCDMINLFFDHAQKPICLVAHNGDNFDFKILREHFKKEGKVSSRINTNSHPGASFCCNVAISCVRASDFLVGAR